MLEPKLSEIAVSIMSKRYLDKDADGRLLETPAQRYNAVATEIAQAETAYGSKPALYTGEFYDMMALGLFLPNTPCLANAGKPSSSGQFSACFVLPVDDSMVSIMQTASDMAMIHKTGGGTGFSFSRLRSKGQYVKTTAGVASGPVSFMRMYSDITNAVKQGGIRRGANMGILRVDHPDILEFITCKTEEGAIDNFNISVGITDKFMHALFNGADYDLVDPRTKQVAGKLSAREVMDLILVSAHAKGDPGLIFLDRVNRLDPLSAEIGEIEATNPCGEVPLRAFDACTLGSIDVSKFVKKDGSIDFDGLGRIVALSVRFLDNVLDRNKYPVAQIHEMTRNCRKIGLGVMGWADMLVKMGVAYTSEAAVAVAFSLMSFISKSAIAESERLAAERGPFPFWEKSVWCKRGDKPRRHATTTVIAPTGTISIFAGCSSGIEPLYALCMVRDQAGAQMVDLHPLFVEIAKREGFYTEDVIAHVTATGSVQGLAAVPPSWQEVFLVANEIPVEHHIMMQGAFQKNVEDAVSKTINMRNSATVAEIEDAYLRAWELGCKGITVYRDGSRGKQVLTAGSGKTEAPKVIPQLELIERRKIPSDGYRTGRTMTRKTAHGAVHVTINDHPEDGEPFEVFIVAGKSGSEVTAYAEGLGRVISVALSMPSPLPPRRRLDLVAEQLAGIGGDSFGFGDNKVSSAADAVSKAIVNFLYKGTPGDLPPKTSTEKDLCPQCHHATLELAGGCPVCHNCGYSKC